MKKYDGYKAMNNEKWPSYHLEKHSRQVLELARHISREEEIAFTEAVEVVKAGAIALVADMLYDLRRKP